MHDQHRRCCHYRHGKGPHNKTAFLAGWLTLGRGGNPRGHRCLLSDFNWNHHLRRTTPTPFSHEYSCVTNIVVIVITDMVRCTYGNSTNFTAIAAWFVLSWSQVVHSHWLSPFHGLCTHKVPMGLIHTLKLLPLLIKNEEDEKLPDDIFFVLSACHNLWSVFLRILFSNLRGLIPADGQVDQNLWI